MCLDNVKGGQNVFQVFKGGDKIFVWQIVWNGWCEWGLQKIPEHYTVLLVRIS